jgi:hypothetical protein
LVEGKKGASKIRKRHAFFFAMSKSIDPSVSEKKKTP